MKSQIFTKLARSQFAVMITAAVLLTAALTTVSIWIYISSGAINIDLSRPGYEKIRAETLSEEPSSQFLSSGPIDRNVIETFNGRVEALQTELNSMNNFSSDVVSDEALGIAES
ncbi:MAG: hypothetical protein LBU20_02680 [Candidatus Nomurabacteria bacterium]|jgi:hypothetical protein|nr:hypothetical protein [Candidatus Nomurabacteria bacterium]